MGWLWIERVTWPERALWAALLVGAIAPTALRPGAEEVREYLAAVDRRDMDAALELTDRDFVLGPRWEDTCVAPRPCGTRSSTWPR